eukprot:Ihof_evm1s400 gene=Ihof_evmTU1s400
MATIAYPPATQVPTQVVETVPVSSEVDLNRHPSGIIPQLQNIVSTVNLGTRLELKQIALHARNAEYNPKRFAAVIMRIREPKTTALIFASGKMVCTGAKSEEESKLAARKYARIIQKLGFPAKFTEFRIQNIVGSCDVKFPIRLEAIQIQHSQFANYEPELFPGLIYRMFDPKIVLLIFVSGKVVLTGAKRRPEIKEKTDDELLEAQDRFKDGEAKSSAKVTRRAPPKIQSATPRVGPGNGREHEAKKVSFSSDTKSVEKDVISLGPLGLPAMAPTEMVPPTKKGSLFANRRRRGQEEEVEGLVDDDDEEEDKPYEHPRDRLDTQDIHFTNVMTKIVEKELKEDQWKMPAYKRSSFPVAQRRVVLSSKTGGKARSIFSMDFDSKRAMAVPSTSNSKPSIEKDIISLDDTPTSQLMPPMDTSSGLLRDDVKREGEGEGECSNYTIGSSSLLESAGVSKEERDAIHEQNVSLLAGMTMDDIAEAKEEILDKIDPDVIKLLRARANKKAVEAKEQHIKLKQENDLNTKKDVVESNSNPHGADDADIGNDQSVVNTVKEKEREIEREEAKESRKKTITINREDGSVSVAITMVDVNGSHDLPVRLPIKPNKKWVNMNQLEVEKFDWMQDRSTPAHGPLAEISKQKLKEEKEKAKQSRIEFVRNFVRFDFTGLIIPFDMDVDSAQALHHHGDDEEYAGYTIKELVHLMRSALPNQRALSLSITSNILHQLLDGMFDEGHTFQTEETEIYVTARDIIGALKNAGYVVGLRLLLDDSKDTVLLAAIGAFSAWLAADYRATPDEDDDDVLQKPPTPTNQSGTESDDSDDEQDEETNSMTEIKELKVMSSKGDYTQVTRFRAYEMPARTLPPMSVAEENEEQITDEDVAKYDAVKGYLAMNVLQRLRYILEVCRIPMTVDYVFDILLRIASYSEDAANAIYECPRLMKCIYTNFGSPQWPPRGSFPNSEFPYGAPHPKAYQLLRVLCASSRTLAAKISLDGTVEASLPLICMDPSSLAINETKRVQQQEVAQRLSWQLGTEALQLWRVLLEYGLCDKLVVSIFPVLVDHLKVATKIRLTINAPMDEKSCVSLAWAASILNLIQSALHLATIQAKENAKNRNKNKNEKGEEEVVIGPGEGIDPSHLVGLFVPVTVLCAEWLPILEEGATNQQQDHNESTLSAEAFDLCAAALHTISSFFTLFSFVESDQLDQEVINTAVVILKDHVLPALKGNVCTWGLSVAVQWVDPVSVGWVGQWAERDGNA